MPLGSAITVQPRIQRNVLSMSGTEQLFYCFFHLSVLSAGTAMRHNCRESFLAPVNCDHSRPKPLICGLFRFASIARR